MGNWDERNWVAFGQLGIVGIVAYELTKHLADIGGMLWSIPKDCGYGLERLGGFCVAAIGASGAVSLGVCFSISIGTIAVAYVYRKEKEQPKFYAIALGLFLNPIFIDFFKDKFNDDQPIQKFLVAACGAVTFLVAMWFWTRASAKDAGRIARIFGKTMAILLFLLPTLCMVGYVAIQATIDSVSFREKVTLPNILGLIGLLITSITGISLSRFYEAP
jgi:hypothetical protein